MGESYSFVWLGKTPRRDPWPGVDARLGTGPDPPTQSWRTFLENHARDLWACNFLPLYGVLFQPIFAFFIVEHESRRVVHFDVTRSPSDEWAAQQLREATPYCEGPRFLIRDNDDKFAAKIFGSSPGSHSGRWNAGAGAAEAGYFSESSQVTRVASCSGVPRYFFLCLPQLRPASVPRLMR